MNIFKIHVDNYNCLKDFNLEVGLNKNKGISPLVLVGLNGTGKSTLLEFIVEIYNNKCLDSNEITRKFNRNNKGEIIYEKTKDNIITLKNNEIHSKLYGRGNRAYENGVYISEESFLPDYLVAYSSGLNNSNLEAKFQEITKHYSNKLKETAKSSAEISKIELRKSLFIDYKLNWFLFFSTYLFEKDEYLKLTKDDFGITIDEITKFVIEWTPPNWAKKSPLPYELEEFLSFLDKYTEKVPMGKITTYTIENLSQFKENLEDILNIQTSRDLFKIFEAFYLLDKDNTECYFESPWLYIKDKKIKEQIDYKSLSDGQHQLIHILGILLMFRDTNSLILLDEPDTHLNPALRSKFTHLINEVMCLDGECNDKNMRSSQIIISTHSPFIVGDTPQENLQHFVKDEKGITTANSVDWQTFGASYSLILSKIFGLHSGISQYAEIQIQELIESGDIEKIESEINDFGKSIKLRELYSKLEELEEENKK